MKMMLTAQTIAVFGAINTGSGITLVGDKYVSNVTINVPGLIFAVDPYGVVVSVSGATAKGGAKNACDWLVNLLNNRKDNGFRHTTAEAMVENPRTRKGINIWFIPCSDAVRRAAYLRTNFNMDWHD